MNIDFLAIYVETVESGSFSAVARRRLVDPSTISRAVATLESTLGVRLLHRSTRRLRTTEAGQRYFERIAPLVEELTSATAEAADASQSPRGVLRLTTSIAFGHEWLVPRLPAFAARFPELDLELALSDTNVDLVDERIDLALRVGSPNGDQLPKSVHLTRLLPVRYGVYASPAWVGAVHPRRPLRTPQELADHPCLRQALPRFRDGWRFRPLAAGDAAAGSEPPVEVTISGRFTLSNPLALRRAAVAGLGPALLADWLAAPAVKCGQLVALFPEWEASAGEFDAAVMVLRPSRSYESAKVRETVAWLRHEAQAG